MMKIIAFVILLLLLHGCTNSTTLMPSKAIYTKMAEKQIIGSHRTVQLLNYWHENNRDSILNMFNTHTERDENNLVILIEIGNTNEFSYSFLMYEYDRRNSNLELLTSNIELRIVADTINLQKYQDEYGKAIRALDDYFAKDPDIMVVTTHKNSQYKIRTWYGLGKKTDSFLRMLKRA